MAFYVTYCLPVFNLPHLVLSVVASVPTQRHITPAQATDKARPTSDDLPPAPRKLALRTRSPPFTIPPAALLRGPHCYSLACPAFLLLLCCAPRLHVCIAQRRTGFPETRQHTTDHIYANPHRCTCCTAWHLRLTATHAFVSCL